MVHIVKKKIGNHEYLYLQKSYHIKGKNKKRTEHVAYLGKVDKYTKQELGKILEIANNQPKKDLIHILKKMNKKGRK